MFMGMEMFVQCNEECILIHTALNACVQRQLSHNFQQCAPIPMQRVYNGSYACTDRSG